jgi:ABC-type multidrug transport system fused ATPase/permease subunit
MSGKGSSKQDGLLRIFSRVHALLTPKERKRALLMLGTVVVNSAVEVLGLAAVVPVIGLAVEPKIIQRYDYLQRAFEASSALGVKTETDFLMLMAISLVVVFGIKALVGLALTLFQTRFSFSVAHRLSGIMWTYHFSQNLEQLRGSNSGRILSEINGWPQGFANTFMVGSLRLITEFFVVAVICVGLLAYEPVVLVSVAILVGAGTLLIRRLTDDRLQAYGQIQKERGPQTNAMVTNAVRGFLEVITFRAVEPVRNEYLRTTKLLYRVSSNSSVINSLPAKTYEVLAVMGVSGAIVISLARGTGGEQFFELLTLMAISAYRIMPTMSRINGAMMEMRRGMYSMAAMEKGVSAVQASSAQEKLETLELNSPPAIVLEGLTVGYTSLPEPVLSGLNHVFEAGRIHAIVGASGSGKSTLVNAMLGLHPLDAGEIRISDGPGEWVLGTTCTKESWLAELGYLSQQPFFFSGTVRDNLTFRAPGRQVDGPLVADLIERLGLKSCLGESPLEFELNEAGTNLSGGQQQRLALLRSLQIPTKVLLLDEATSALDVDSRDKVFGLLRERAEAGTLIIIITHDREMAGMCDEVLDLES